MAKIVLYDLPSKDRRSCWSLNPWKTRMILNYKKIEYETVWLEYPEVAPTLKGFGLPPNEKAALFAYTIPTIKTLDSTYIMDSDPISKYLEEIQPTPSLHLDSPNLARVVQAINDVQTASRGVWMPQVPDAYLNPISFEFFQRTRREIFGMPLEEFAKQNGGEEAWVKATSPLQKLGEILLSKGGPFVEGEEDDFVRPVRTSR